MLNIAELTGDPVAKNFNNNLSVLFNSFTVEKELQAS